MFAASDSLDDIELAQAKLSTERVERRDKLRGSVFCNDCPDVARMSVERTISTNTDDVDSKDSIGRQETREQSGHLGSLLGDPESEVNAEQRRSVTEDTTGNVTIDILPC